MAAPSMVADATGVPRSQETAPPWDPQVGLCLGPYGGPLGSGGHFLMSEEPLHEGGPRTTGTGLHAR